MPCTVEAVGLVASLAGRHAIDCALKSGALTAAASSGDLKTLETQAALMHGFGYARTELLDRAAKHAPARRLVSIEDVGVATAILASDHAKLITGETVYVDGGYHILG